MKRHDWEYERRQGKRSHGDLRTCSRCGTEARRMDWKGWWVRISKGESFKFSRALPSCVESPT